MKKPQSRKRHVVTKSSLFSAFHSLIIIRLRSTRSCLFLRTKSTKCRIQSVASDGLSLPVMCDVCVYFFLFLRVDTIPREFSGEKLVFVLSPEKERQSTTLFFFTFFFPYDSLLSITSFFPYFSWPAVKIYKVGKEVDGSLRRRLCSVRRKRSCFSISFSPPLSSLSLSSVQYNLVFNEGICLKRHISFGSSVNTLYFLNKFITSFPFFPSVTTRTPLTSQWLM